jgi:prepilin-type N-terminal cleavage/methylation domain-containing protein/prepilin-type processing-associated H-X9-DG protein
MASGFMKRRAFTLIELLVVISIISILAAIIWPAFAAAREKARQTTCVNNLRQIGMAVQMYASDSNGIFPLGGDPQDLNTNAWQVGYGGQFWPEMRHVPPLPTLMMPYTSTRNVWRCPSDTGITTDTLDMGNLPLTGNSFLAYGSSYYYHTELAVRHLSIDTVAAYYHGGITQYGSNIPMLFDGSGTWHGEANPVWQRYDVVFCDGHVQSMTAVDFWARFSGSLVPPS